MKRLTYLQKRNDQTTTEFRDYWRSEHAALAAECIPATMYRQHLVIARRKAPRPHSFVIDGIVELTFDDASRFAATFSSDAGDLLEADERNFVSGFSGSHVHGDTPHDPPTASVWVLVENENHTDSVLDMVTQLTGVVHPLLQTTDRQHDVLTRESLAAIDVYPPSVLEIPLRDLDAAQKLFVALDDESLSSCELLVTETFAVI